MKRLLLITICSVLVSLGACVQQPRPNISAQSPDEILETMRLLMNFDGDTRLRDYEDILGGHLVLTKSVMDGLLPFQTYTLAGPPDRIQVTMNIMAIARNADLGKQVTIRVGNVNSIGCITRAHSQYILSKKLFYGGVSGRAPNVYSYGRPFHLGWPGLAIGYNGTGEDGCIDNFFVGYSPMVEGWGH